MSSGCSYPGRKIAVNKIPKRIIQIWGGGRELPLLSRAAAVSAQLLNPDFEYVLFDDAMMNHLVRTNFPQYKKMIDCDRLPAQKYDLFKYLAVYRLGGIYLDFDVLLANGFSDLLDFGCVFPFGGITVNPFLRNRGQDWEVGTYAFGAAAGHPFIRAVIENCIRAQEDPSSLDAMLMSVPKMFRESYYALYSTGPGLVSRTLAEYPYAATDITILFPDDVCDPVHWGRFGPFGVHLVNDSRQNSSSPVQRNLQRYWYSRKLKKSLKKSKCLSLNRQEISSALPFS